jgi:hypothetical protein
MRGQWNKDTTQWGARGSTLQLRVASDSVLRSGERRFYLWMAGVFVLIAFGGFTP